MCGTCKYNLKGNNNPFANDETMNFIYLLSSILDTLMCLVPLFSLVCFLSLAQCALQFDHFLPLRLQECSKFLQGEQPYMSQP
jgi:hypothetical protein